MKSKGPSYALIKTDVLNTWLNQKKICLVWLISGAKLLEEDYNEQKKGIRHNFSGVYFVDNDKVKGNFWFLNVKQV